MIAQTNRRRRLLFVLRLLRRPSPILSLYRRSTQRSKITLTCSSTGGHDADAHKVLQLPHRPPAIAQRQLRQLRHLPLRHPRDSAGQPKLLICPFSCRLPPPAHGRKRALICGVSYRRTRHELKWSINDAKCMRYFLANRYHFPEESILTLTEEEADPYRIPTKQNIRMELHWLVQGCQPGDSLVFHYSGHGSQQRNYNGDEIDGYDETICPLDFETQGMIVDDEINATIVRLLPHGVKLHAIIDAS